MDSAVRERLLEVVLFRLESTGRKEMRLAEILVEAGVAAADFDAEYPDLDSCLGDAYEWLATRMDGAVKIGCATGGGRLVDREAEWPLRVRGGLEALLRELAASPAMARVLTWTYPSLGSSQRARYETFLDSFASKLRSLRRASEDRRPLPVDVDTLAVGAAEAIVIEEIRDGRARNLAALGPEILFSLLAPLIGAGAAADEMERARQED